MKSSQHIQNAMRHASNIEALADAGRTRHIQPIVEPARKQEKPSRGLDMIGFVIGILIFAAAIGTIAAHWLR